MNPMTSRIVPPGFPTKRDRDLYIFAIRRIEAGEDLDFYLQRGNAGFVLKDGEPVRIDYGGAC